MTRHVAIVGAGPSGCFLAQALLKARPDLAVDLIDRLPVPYGLVRYGVAADHQGTKAIARQFARLFERQGARFHGNVEIGRDCLLCGQVGIAGSARIGDRVVMGGQCGVSDNIFVGDDVVAGGATKIFTNAPAGRVLLGSPAMKMESHVEAWKNIRRLPRLFAQVAELRRAAGRGNPESEGDDR